MEVSFSTPLAALECVALDTETTGLDARSARLVQIGAVRIADGAVHRDRSFETLVNPGVPIPKASSAVHGISDDDVAAAPRFGDVAGDLESFIGEGVVVGHTIGYDLTILQREAALAGRPWRAPRTLDIRVLAELALPSLAQYDLDRIASLLGVTIDGRHTAMGDAVATAQVYTALLPLLRERGIRTLAETEAAARALADRQASGGVVSPLAAAAAAGPLPTALTRIDSFPYRHRLAEVMSAPPVFCPPATTVRDALRLLLERRISSVIVSAGAEPAGLVTERDLLRAIDRDPVNGLAGPVGAIASRPLIALPESAYVYRAIGRVGRLGIRHLAVSSGTGEIVGMVTTRNLLRHRATTAIVLGDEIDAATSPAALAKAWGSLTTMARSLISEDVDPRRIAGVVSEEIAALTRRAAELSEQRMLNAGHGPPPVPYAVLVLGSVGRGESLLAADQDNAIVYASGAPGGAEDKWFATLGGHISDILDEAGVPYCKGGVMAKMPAWRNTVDGWKGTIDGWVRRQRPEDLLNVDIFFDGAVVHGDSGLGETILAHAFQRAGQARDFQLQLALMAQRWNAPLTWLGGIKTGAEGRVDLKMHGLMPIFSAARALAIKHGIRDRATPERLRALRGFNIGSDDDMEALIEAHRIIIGAMLGQQLVDSEAGVPLSPRVEVKRLDPPQKDDLKSALRNVSIAIGLVSEGRL
jgi:CBS domain-containing protein